MLPAEPALVGREQQLEQLLQHLNLSFNGQGVTVFVGGEAGVGKTRLIKEFLNLARKKGVKVLSGWCLSEATLPYFPFTEAFNTYLSTSSDTQIKKVLTKHLGITRWIKGPEITGESARQLGLKGWLRGPEQAREEARMLVSTPEIERDRTFEATATAFLQMSAHEPVILFLDDLHWADHLSLALIHYVARRCRKVRLLIVGTYRPEELIRTREEKLHPLEETMFSMSRENLLTRMELNRLKRDDFPELLRSVFHSEFDEKFVEKLYSETEGNPLFVLETLNLLAEEGSISERGEQWVLTAPAEKIGIPSKVQEVITRRVSRLEREERRLLDHAAVCGHSFSIDTLRRTMSLDKIDVLERLADIERKHKLIRPVDSTFEFTHEKIRKVLYDDLQGELRREYHLKTASCLEQALAEKIPNGYLADIAFHYVEGGAVEKAFEYLVELGEKAVNTLAPVQAMEYLNKALEATQKDATLASAENLSRIYQFRGRALWGTEGAKIAVDDFKLMLQNATNASNESMIAEAHYLLGSAYAVFDEFSPYSSLTRYRARVMPHLTTALELSRKVGDKRLEGRIRARIGSGFIAALETMDEGRVWLEEAYEICKETDNVPFEAYILHQLASYYDWKGEFSLANENMKKALALEEKIGVPQRTIGRLLTLSKIQAGMGEYNDAISTGQRCLQLTDDYGAPAVASIMLNTLGWIYHDLSCIELALKYNNESLELARTLGAKDMGGLPHALANLGNDYLYKNDYTNAEKYFTEASGHEEQHRSGWWRMESRFFLSFGEIAIAKGNYSQALKFAEDSLGISEKAGAKKYVAKGLKLKAEVLSEMGKSDEAINLMEKALRLAQEVGNPPLLWQTHYSMGLLLEKHGNPQEASQHYAKATALLEETASKLEDASLRTTLLAAPRTVAIHDAYARTKSSS